MVALLAPAVVAAPAAEAVVGSLAESDAPLVCDGDKVSFSLGSERFVRVRVPAGAQVRFSVTVDVTGTFSSDQSILNIHAKDLSLNEYSFEHGLLHTTVGPDLDSIPGTSWSMHPYPGTPVDEPREIVVRIMRQYNKAHGHAVVELVGASGWSLAGCRIRQLLGSLGDFVGLAGDPANTFTGNVTDRRMDVGARAGTSGPVSERHYNSLDLRSGLLGRGWRLGYETSVEQVTGEDPDPANPGQPAPPERSDVVWVDPEGRESVFAYDWGSQGWLAPPGVAATLAWVSDHYELVWSGSGARWVFDANAAPPAPARLESVEQPSGEVVDLVWADDGGTSGVVEVLRAWSSLDPSTVWRWTDVDTDGVVDELWVDSPAGTHADVSVNYFYESEGGTPVLSAVSVPHRDDVSGADPWGPGGECSASVPCEVYESEDPRTPQALDFPWITRVVDPSGVEVLSNTYELEAPYRVTVDEGVTAGRWWPTVDAVGDSTPAREVRSALVHLDDRSGTPSGQWSLQVGGGPVEVFDWDVDEATLEAFVAAQVPGSTVEGVAAQTNADGWWRIVWGDDAHHGVAVTDGVTNLDVSSHDDVAWDDPAEWVTPVFAAGVPGTEVVPVGTDSGVMDVVWPTAQAHELTLSSAGLVGGSVTVAVVEDARFRSPRVVSQSYPSGDEATFAYGLASSFTYGPGGSLTAAWDTEVTYDDGSSVETLTYHHDVAGFLVGITDPADASVERGYQDGQLSSFVDRSGVEVTRSFDAAGRLVGWSRPDPGSTGDASAGFVEYDGEGRVVNQVGADGVTTSMVYPPSSQSRVPEQVRVCAEQPDGPDAGSVPDPCPATVEPSEFSVNAAGLVSTVVEPSDQGGSRVTTTYSYPIDYEPPSSPPPGCVGWQLCEVDSGGVLTSYTYDQSTGLVASVTTAAGTTTYTYHPDGSLAEVRDPLYDGVSHHARTLGYDGAGRLLWMSDESNPDVDGPGGSYKPSVEYRYDTAGQLVREIQSLDPTKACLSSGSGQPKSSPSRCTVTRYRYDGAGNLVSVTEADDGDNAFGASETDAPDEATTTYTYGILGRLTRVTDPVGVQTHSCYDTEGNVVRRVVGSGTPSCVGAEGAGFEVSATAYDGWGRVACEVGPTDEVVWASDGSPDCDAAGTVGESVYTYNEAGAVVSVVEARGTGAERSTSNVYDGLGRLWQRVEPRGVGATAWSGVVEERGYYPSGRVATVRTPPHDAVSWDWGLDVGCFDPTVSPCPSVAGVERTTTYSYDGAGRVASVTDPAGRVRETAYDASGRVDVVTDAAGTAQELVVDYDPDPLGRVTKVVMPSPTGVGTVAQLRTFDPVGRLLTETDFAVDPALSSTPTRRFSYNHAGWLVASRAPGLAWDERVQYGYDSRGNRTSRVSHRSDSDDTPTDDFVESWVYDRAGRVVSVTDPLSNATTFEYDSAAPSGVVAGRLWRRSDPEGRSATYGYVGGRVDEVVYAQPGEGSLSVGYGYDGLGRVTETAVGSAVESRAYDGAGRVVSVTDGNGGVVASVWDVVGARRFMGHPGGRQSLFSHDEAGQLSGASVWAWGVWLPVSDFVYDEMGRVTRELGCCGNTSVNRHWSYNTAGKATDYTQCWRSLFGQCWSDPPQPPPPPLGEDPPPFYKPFVAESIVSWRADGRVGRVCVDDVDNGVCADPSAPSHPFVAAYDRSYVYDSAGQLVGAGNDCVLSGGVPGAACTSRWSFDLQGNRVGHDPDTTVGGDVDYVFDGGGRVVGSGDGCALVSGVPNASCDTTFSYDDSGRRVARDGVGPVTYDYDVRGRLASVDGVGDSQDFVLGHDVEDLSDVTYPTGSGSATVTVSWDHGLGVPEIVAWGAKRIDYGLERTSQISVGGDWDYGYDWMGNSTRSPDWGGVPDGDGNVGVYGVLTYDPYGVPQDATGDTASAEFGYRGELHLGDLIYLRNRIYDPTTGTFLSPDPIDGHDGTPTVANAYHYSETTRSTSGSARSATGRLSVRASRI